MKLNFLVIALFFLLSCEKDPIFGLERGWLRNSEEELTIRIIRPEEGDVWEIGNTYSISFKINKDNFRERVGIALKNNSNGDYILNDISYYEWVTRRTGYADVRLSQSDPPGSYELSVRLVDEVDLRDVVNITIVE